MVPTTANRANGLSGLRGRRRTALLERWPRLPAARDLGADEEEAAAIHLAIQCAVGEKHQHPPAGRGALQCARLRSTGKKKKIGSIANSVGRMGLGGKICLKAPLARYLMPVGAMPTAG